MSEQQRKQQTEDQPDKQASWHDAIATFTKDPTLSRQPTRPNIFEIAGFPHSELVSSNVLAYFFDPEENHRFHDMMLRALLRILNKENEDISEVSVETEVSTDKKKRIDILITLSELSIAIENKVDATLYNDLKEYQNRAGKEGKPAIVVVLHPDDKINLEGHKSARGLSLKKDLFDVRYDELFSATLDLIGEYLLDADSRAVELLQQYIDNYSPERRAKTMENIDEQIEEFTTKSEGIEEQLINAYKSFQLYHDAAREKLENIQKEILGAWGIGSNAPEPEDGTEVVHGVHKDFPNAKLVEHWVYPKTQSRGSTNNIYYNLRFKLESAGNDKINIEFFLNPELNDGAERDSHTEDLFTTIWYKVYKNTSQAKASQITVPYHQILGVKLTDPSEEIQQAMEAIVKKVLEEYQPDWKLKQN